MALEKVKELSTWLPTSGLRADGSDILNRTINVHGTADAIILDEDGDTTISAPTDDQIDVEVAGSDCMTFTSKNCTLINNTIQAGEYKDTLIFLGIAEQENVLSGAVDPNTYSTTIQVGAGGAAYTLADGSQTGQIKKVKLKAFEIGPPDTGVLTPTSFGLNTDITFAAVGDFIVLRWQGGASGWTVLEIGNDANGTGGPTVA